MADLLDFDAARARILSAAHPLGTSVRLLSQSAGHCLAETLHARLTQPPFTASAMDGYAMIAASAEPGRPMPVIGRAEAGRSFDGVLVSGQAVRIFTGAPLPAGADCVVVQEDTTSDGEHVILLEQPVPGRHVREMGNDFSINAPVLEKGARLTPAALALAAAAGHADLPVTRRPRLALLATGNELVPPGTLPGPDQIVASNSAGLQALFAPFSETIDDLGILGDDETALRETLSAAFDGPADVIVTSGGASVGDKDLIRPVLADLGVSLDLWRIAMRPGKPLMFARANDKLFFGLPGNPVSALTTAMVLVVPALRALAGDHDPGPHYQSLPLSAPLGANGARRHFHRARLVPAPGGTRVAPIAEADSAHLTSFAEADCLIVHKEDSPALAEGALVDVLVL